MAEVIERCGHQVYVANTGKLAYLHQADDKNDRGDAYKLAELVYFKPGLLHPIRHRSQEAQADLSWIRAREALIRSRPQLVNTVRGISKSFGERLPRCSAEAFTTRLAGRIPETVRGAVAPLLETLDHLSELIRYYDQMEARLAEQRYPEHRLLDQVDGVGVHTALSYMLTLGRCGALRQKPPGGMFPGNAAAAERLRSQPAAVGDHQGGGTNICARRWAGDRVKARAKSSRDLDTASRPAKELPI